MTTRPTETAGLTHAIATLDSLLAIKRSHARGREPRRTAHEHILRGARMVLTALELGGTVWSRPRERRITGASRAALWRHVILSSGIEQMHKGVTIRLGADGAKARWTSLNVPCERVPLLAASPSPAELEELRHGPKNDEQAALMQWLSGTAPDHLHGAQLLGMAMRHKIAHGTISPTRAKRWGMADVLASLCNTNVQWAIGLLHWAADDLKNNES